MIYSFKSIIWLTFYLGAIQLSCKSQEVTVAKEEMSCRDSLKMQLLEYWSYDSAKNTYSGTNGMIRLTSERRGCLREMKKDEIIEFFGKPSLDKGDRLYYFSFEECWLDTVNLRYCYHFSKVYFDNEGYYKYMSP
jgi:hypothetical protein